MKKLVLSIIALIPFSSYAELPSLIDHLCKDPEVVLSKLEIPCKPDDRLSEDFDIPQLEIDINELDKIFQDSKMGADSSGGHTAGPMQMPTGRLSQLNVPVTMNCEARLVADGGKKLSFLSIQKFTLSEYTNSITLHSTNWKHYLMEGNLLYPSAQFEVPTPPSVKIDQFIVKLSNPNQGTTRRAKLLLSVCEQNVQEKSQSKVMACAENERSKKAKRLKARLRLAEISSETGYTVTKTLQVKCKRD